ncbi:MAG: carboxypeptidase regulatory-like domain-containing protein [Actinomycetales bacterium]|nr:carboxypeptidase regulatory-like domain-containing protein [Actinomycetales bacterium]
MRVVSAESRVEIAAPAGTGPRAALNLEVVNTSSVIDAVTVEVRGPTAPFVIVSPTPLVLFPEATGTLRVTFDLPEHFPAGNYLVDLVVQGKAPGTEPTVHTVEVDVTSRPALRLLAEPSVVRARSNGAFAVRVTNEGNEPLDVALRAEDTDRQLTATLVPSTLHVGVGASALTNVVVRGPRQLYGSDRDRPLTVVATANDVTAEAPLVFRQRSTFSRGLVTALVLALIIAAWALAFVLGMGLVLGSDPLTKVAPASLFAAAAAETPDGADPDGAAGPGTGGAPADALPKDGALPAGVGGILSGTVRGAADGAGVGRLTVELLRESRDGLVLVSSSATQADGTYELAGLFPGHYYVRVADEGYDEIWYPRGASEASGQTVRVRAQQATDGVDLTVVGHPASLEGAVATGLPDGEVTVRVVATPVWADADPGLVQSVDADPDGSYRFDGLEAPGSYELSFEAEGYQGAAITERVLGGQDRLALDVRLSAGVGRIAGTVTDGVSGLGGVTVTTTVDGEQVEVGTPTQGQVGRFVLDGLATPATYVLSFAKEGFETVTSVVELGPGETQPDLTVAMAGGVGTVAGTVVDTDGNPLGGVTVTAGGASAVTTTTLTAGAVGTYSLAGLPQGQEVTLTFTHPGYVAVSIPVQVGEEDPPTVTMASASGRVTGRVTQGGAALVGATVQATDGLTVHSTTTTSSGDGGTYVLPDLAPGTWTVSVVRDGRSVVTALVEVRRGVATTRNLTVPEGD